MHCAGDEHCQAIDHTAGCKWAEKNQAALNVVDMIARMVTGAALGGGGPSHWERRQLVEALSALARSGSCSK